MKFDITFPNVVQRDRTVVLASVSILATLAWVYTVHLADKSPQMFGAMAMPAMSGWGAADFLFMFTMWAVMMIAMMLPSATPMILIFEKICKKRKSEQQPFVPTMIFVAGYLFVWIGFSIFATALNWWLHVGGQLSSVMGHTPPIIGGVILVAAGVFQWTPLKQTCLKHCRSPISFLMTNWREGAVGAMKMGLHHGSYCLGCCWLLMVLLFVLGVMNLAWVAVLTIVILVEKVLPGEKWLSRVLGGILVIWGGCLIVLG
jgi:predicted metal-binding membrane protein